MAITTPSDLYLDFDAFLYSIKQNLDGSFAGKELKTINYN
jgi:hypothetical protein